MHKKFNASLRLIWLRVTPVFIEPSIHVIATKLPLKLAGALITPHKAMALKLEGSAKIYPSHSSKIWE